MDIDSVFAYDSFRPGQRELASRIRSHCLTGGLMLAEAMSGFGKTAAVLCGAVAAAEETRSKIVYACRTKRQISRVAEELSRLQKKHGLKAAALSSKFDYCLLKRTTPRSIPQESFRWYCGFNTSNNLCSYFLNVTLLGERLEKEVDKVATDVPTQESLLHESEHLHVCPYELARLAAAQSKVTVVPYPYVFDPGSSRAVFDSNGTEPSNTILVVDEAHNVRDFMRGLHSGSITLGEIDGAAREASALLMTDVATELRELKRAFERTMSEASGWYLDRDSVVARLAQDRGGVWLQNLAFALCSCSAAAWGSVVYERRFPSLILKVGEFLVKLSSSDGGVLAKWGDAMGMIDPNPVKDLAKFLDSFRSSVLLSATINPSSVFLRSLGVSELQPEVYISSTQSFVSVRTVIDTGVTTRFKSRSPQMYSRISDKIASVIKSTANGVGVFAPSYDVLAPIADMVSKRVDGRTTLSERRGMSSEESAGIMDTMMSDRGSVLFAVQGGRFSEGEDFRGDMMDAVAVVGLSLPPPSPMLYAEYACLKRSGEPDSYLMLSRLPALRKAFQAAGRHIRDPGKRGLVFLLDSRFDAPVMRELMPSWLSEDVVSGDFEPREIEAIASDFWKQGQAS